MAIGDWVLKTWSNGVDVSNAVNFQRFEDKINELDKYSIPRYKIKPSDENVTSSTTPQNDNDLVVSLEANSIWEIDVNLSVVAIPAAGFRSCYLATGGVSILSRRLLDSPTQYSATYTYDCKIHRGTFTTLGDTSALMGEGFNHEKLLVQTIATGTLQLQWAQAASNATPTTVQIGSYIKVTKVRSF